MLHTIINFLQNFDEYLLTWLTGYEHWVYAILGATIFLETAFLFAAFLPGDSLLIAAGALANREPQLFNIHLVFCLLFTAGIFGNLLNYGLGCWLGPIIFRKNHSRYLNMTYLDKAQSMYQRSGGRIILIASFIPILRTFAAFIAGCSQMSLVSFGIYMVIGTLTWVSVLLYGSYYVDNIAIVREHFGLMVLFITVLVFAPIFLKLIKQR